MARRPTFECALLVLAFLLACSKSRSGSDAGDASGAAGTAGGAADAGGSGGSAGAGGSTSLVDWKARSVAIDASAFPGTPEGAFWTSSRVAGAAANAVTVDFTRSDSAGTFSVATNSPQNVRCVR